MKLLEPYNCRRFLKDCGNLFFTMVFLLYSDQLESLLRLACFHNVAIMKLVLNNVAIMKHEKKSPKYSWA